MYMVDLYDSARQKELTDIVSFLTYIYAISMCILIYYCFHEVV